MIFKILAADIVCYSEVMLSDMLSDIISHGHYIECDVHVRHILVDAVAKHGSTAHKQWLSMYKGFDITYELRQYLSIIPFSSYSPKQVKLIANKPARILMENSREWPVYQNLIGCFKKDRKYSNLFSLLEKAKCTGNLDYLQAGGKPELIPLFNSINSGEYKDIAGNKCCFVFDRDTNDEYSFSEQSNRLFELFCHKSYSHMSNDDVYTLSLGNYIWHMWYRREIENYFPYRQYSLLGYSLCIPPSQDSYYEKVENKYVKRGGSKFDKNDLPRLTQGMDRSTYEEGLKLFDVNGDIINEIQLFLLKLVKII